VLATVNLSTKFEVAISIRYEDMKGDAKCGKWGGLGQLRVTFKIIGNSIIR